MRIFLAGATGVIGVRLMPLLVDAGHEVAGMTRSPAKVDLVRSLGAEAVVCDVFDEGELVRVVRAFAPEMVMHQLTDLPDNVDDIASFSARNDRMRTDGTRNLLEAATAAGARRFLAQSIAWRPAGRGGVVDEHEQMVLEAGGVVVRYGQLYGPGTYYEDRLPAPPRVSVDEAARRTVPLLDAGPGVVEIVEG
jgi:nucleoside-diphosphate-sugar epimerase